MADAGLFCLALSLAVLSLFAVPAYAASDVWDDVTADSVTTDGYTVRGQSSGYRQKVRSINTWNPATGGVEFSYTLAHSGGYGSGDWQSLAGLGQDPFAASNPSQEYTAIEYAIFHNTNGGRITIYESGLSVFSPGVTWTPQGNDVFKIAIDSAGTVRFYLNGALLYTSTETASGDYYLHYTPNGREALTLLDTTPPAVTAPADVTVETTEPLITLDIGAATATDDFDTNPTVTNDVPESFPIGVTTVTWTATDGADNTATATQTVTVRATPSLTIVPPPFVSAEATGPLTTLDIGAATATSNLDPNPTVTNDAPVGGFSLGATTVTWTATDSSGNMATATQVVTVQDTTPPTIAAPYFVVAEATGPQTTLDTGTATAADAVDPNPTVTNDAPAGGFPLGATTVTWTATDFSGNMATAGQSVTVRYSYSQTLHYDHTRTPGNTTDTVTLVAHRNGDHLSLDCKFFTAGNATWNNQSTTYYAAVYNTTETVHMRCHEGSDAIPAFQVTSYAPYRPGSGFDLVNDTLGSDGLFGVPIPFMFVLLVAAMWTGRSAQVGIIVTAATIGIMAALGLFELAPEAWAMIILLTATGVFLGKKLF